VLGVESLDDRGRLSNRFSGLEARGSSARSRFTDGAFLDRNRSSLFDAGRLALGNESLDERGRLSNRFSGLEARGLSARSRFTDGPFVDRNRSSLFDAGRLALGNESLDERGRLSNRLSGLEARGSSARPRLTTCEGGFVERPWSFLSDAVRFEVEGRSALTCESRLMEGLNTVSSFPVTLARWPGRGAEATSRTFRRGTACPLARSISRGEMPRFTMRLLTIV
jgi:hypothetical protein